MELAPDNGVVINATMNIESTGYKIDVLTLKGNKFSTTFSPTFVAFMGTVSVTITNVAFNEGNPNTISISLKNTGTTTVTIAQIKVNNAIVTIDNTSTLTYAAGDTGTITIDESWVAGNPYKMDLYDSSGQVVGSYQATAPRNS